MENVEIASVRNEVADLPELEGENRFRVRAYCNAARTVEAMAQPPLAEPMKIEGIGPKRATRFYHELGVNTVAQLERGLERGDPRLTNRPVGFTMAPWKRRKGHGRGAASYNRPRSDSRPMGTTGPRTAT